jgi:crotonobetainyl-CoA:carnitine CoA-transferase CaiB-like acyl-CoA transferase
LRSLPDALASAQVETRGFVQTLEDGVAVPTLPFRLGGAAAYAPGSSAPAHGEHTAEILAWLDHVDP